MLKYVFIYPAALHTSVFKLHIKWRLKPAVHALLNELMITNVTSAGDKGLLLIRGETKTKVPMN